MVLGAGAATAVWDGNSCTALRTEHGKIGVFSTLISDLVLLILMLFGLLRWEVLDRDTAFGGSYTRR